MAKNNGIDLTVLNPDGIPLVYSKSLAVSLKFSITNNTGSDISFVTGSSALEIYLPPAFTETEMKSMSIQQSDWSFTPVSEELFFKLSYTGSQGIWADGTDFSFFLNGVTTQSDPTSGDVQVNFLNFPAGVPSQRESTLVINNPPVVGNGDLKKVLEISLDNQGMILVSPKNDPLQNTLFLNIKNIGKDPIYNGKAMWTGDPQIIVTFIYGDTTGSLAPDDKQASGPGSGSAWNILSAIPYKQEENIWKALNPLPASTFPQWTLKPSNLNNGVIGTGQNSDITFSFSNIISFTPPGHTQMILQFKGFMKDEKTKYDDALFVLNIVKQNSPPVRGLISFFSIQSVVTVNKPDTPIEIPLRWSMFNVARVEVITSFPGIGLIKRPYPNPLPVAYDTATVTIPGVTQSTAITITIQAYDGNNGFLNSMQFTMFIQANMFVDPVDGKVYPIVKIRNRLWMSKNLARVTTPGSAVIGPESQYGRLYEFKVAGSQQLLGWRLPNEADWKDLADNYTYEQLIPGGSTGFDAQFSGIIEKGGSQNDFKTRGFYWSSANREAGVGYVVFSAASASKGYKEGMNPEAKISVRYVKDVG